MSGGAELARWKRLRKKRQKWEPLWQELAEVLHPVRADITESYGEGQSRQDVIFDGTPMQNRRSLSTTIGWLMRGKSTDWFSGSPAEKVLKDIDDVKKWYEEVTDIMYSAIYERNARFVQRAGEAEDDLVTFGTGALFIGERSDLGGLKFVSIHPKQIAIAENSDGVIDTLYYDFKLTARQAAQKFGEKELPDHIRKALSDKSGTDQMFTFVQCVRPREEVEHGRMGNDNLPFASITVEEVSAQIVEETGFNEFPFSVPRWDTATGEIYGRSPGMVALPDAKTLQAMGKTLLIAGQKAVDPPLWLLDEAVIGVPRTFPGGVTIIDSEAARGVGSPFGTLQTGSNMPLGLEMQNQTRQMVEGAFFRNVFNLPVGGPQMTATEVIQRKEEFIRQIGPIFGRLEVDYIGQIVERVFGILQRAGKFPPPPEELIGSEPKFEFRSPIEQARKQIESTSIAEAINSLAPIIQFQPEVMDNFDGDAIVRSTPDGFGVPAKWLRNKDDVSAMRQAKQQAAQEQQALEQADQAASIADKVAE